MIPVKPECEAKTSEPSRYTHEDIVGPATIRASPEGMTVTMQGVTRLARTASEREDLWVWAFVQLEPDERAAVKEAIQAAWAVHVSGCMAEVETRVELAKTRKLERPELVSMPLPAPWHPSVEGLAVIHRMWVDIEVAFYRDSIDETEQLGHDLIALAKWRRHEERVAAQKRAPAGDAAGARARQGSMSEVTNSGSVRPVEPTYSARDLKCISSVESATDRSDQYRVQDGDVTLVLRYKLKPIRGRDVWCLVSSQVWGASHATE